MTRPLTPAEIAKGKGNPNIGTECVSDAGGLHVWHIRLSPGASLPPHHHDRPYCWTVLTAGTAQSRYDNGDVIDIVYKAGDTKVFSDLSPENSFVHDLTNTGDDELIFVTVEFNPEQGLQR